MATGTMNQIPEHIVVSCDGGSIAVESRRPDITPILCGRKAGAALARIPTLLPICGTAQAAAATLAVQSAGGRTPESTHYLNAALVREQCLSAAFRLTIDYPALLNEAPLLAELRRVRQADGPGEMATALRALLPGFDSVVDGGITATSYATLNPGLPARVLLRAMEHDRQHPVTGRAPVPVSGDGLWALMIRGIHPKTADQPIMVGPYATRRHPRTTEVLSQVDGLLAQLVLAHLMDTWFIASLLEADADSPVSLVEGRATDDGVGVGMAQTSRGPVYHRVTVGDDETVTSWQITAPTDWHFSPNGPVSNLRTGTGAGDEWLKCLVLGFDPCAPWRVAGEEA